MSLRITILFFFVVGNEGKSVGSGLQNQVLNIKIYLPQSDREQGIRDKHGRQRTREKGIGTREMGQGYLSWGDDKGLLLNWDQTDGAHKKMVAFKGKMGSPRLG